MTGNDDDDNNEQEEEVVMRSNDRLWWGVMRWWGGDEVRRWWWGGGGEEAGRLRRSILWNTGTMDLGFFFLNQTNKIMCFEAERWLSILQSASTTYYTSSHSSFFCWWWWGRQGPGARVPGHLPIIISRLVVDDWREHAARPTNSEESRIIRKQRVSKRIVNQKINRWDSSRETKNKTNRKKTKKRARALGSNCGVIEKWVGSIRHPIAVIIRRSRPSGSSNQPRPLNHHRLSSSLQFIAKSGLNNINNKKYCSPLSSTYCIIHRHTLPLSFHFPSLQTPIDTYVVQACCKRA